MSKVTPKTPRESDIQRAVMDYLAARGFRIFRRNVMGIVPMQKGGVVRVGQKGMADLYGWFRGNGIHIEVEVKRPDTAVSPEQAAWLGAALVDNAIAFATHSVEECERQLRMFGF